jgi:putative ABC transport system substrate-binding protein
MQRRRFITLLGAAITAARTLRAQQKAMPVIGFLAAGSPGPGAPFVAAFRQGLSEAGYVEGQNLAIEYRWAESHYDRLPALAVDLVGSKVDLIATSGGDLVALAARNATSTIPIVFIGGSDPVERGLVASLARPGANVTGFSDLLVELYPKRLELLSELVPQARVIALLVNPNSASAAAQITREVQDAARTRGMQLPILQAGTENEIEAAFATLLQLHADGLVVSSEPFFTSRREQLVGLAARHAVPAILTARLRSKPGPRDAVEQGSNRLGWPARVGVGVWYREIPPLRNQKFADSSGGGQRIRTFGSAMRWHRRQRGGSVTPPDPGGSGGSLDRRSTTRSVCRSWQLLG